LLAISSLVGELAENQSLVDALRRWLKLLYGVGAEATLIQAR